MKQHVFSASAFLMAALSALALLGACAQQKRNLTMNQNSNDSAAQAAVCQIPEKADSVQAKDIDEYAKKSMFAVGEPNAAYSQYFDGNTWLSPLNTKDAAIANVTFEPGAINHWHIHKGEAQILVGVGGHGWVQFEGKPAQAIHAGDVVHIPPGVKHWHGAAKDSWFSHLSISVKSGEGEMGTDWLEPVASDDYNKLE